MIGRPRGTSKATAVRSLNGPPIHHDGAGRADKLQPGYCDSCKVPPGSDKVLTFELRLAGKPAGHWSLCQPCWEWRNGRFLDPDPLHTSEDAA